MKIAHKFLLLLLFIGFSALLINVLLMLNTQRAIDRISNFSEESLPELIELQRIRSMVDELVVRVVTQPGQVKLNEQEAKVKQILQELAEREEIDDEYEIITKNEAEEVESLRLLNERFDFLIQSARSYKLLRADDEQLEAAGIRLQDNWSRFAAILDSRIESEINEFNTNYQSSQEIVHQNWMQGWIIIVTGLIVLIFIGVFLHRLVISPLRYLDHAVSTMIRQERLSDIPSDRKDEIGALTNSFNQLSRSLNHTLANLEESNNKLLERNQELIERNRQIVDQKKEIDAQNEDLKRFAYATSHDLKTPLRGMANLTDWLLKEKYDELGKVGQEYLTLLNERLKWLFHLVEGILEYSKAASEDLQNREEVDLSKLISATLDLMDRVEGTEILYKKDLPTIQVYSVVLQQILYNLISNAINYNDKAAIRVEIAFKESKDAYEISVSDNGPGIDPKYHDQIFELFKTLGQKDRNNQMGTGIGLATVKRMVTKLGGEIRLKSEIDQGSTFTFTLAK